MSDFRLTPVDSISAERLAGDGLALTLIDTTRLGEPGPDRDAYDEWLQVGWRGFHEGRLDEEGLAWTRGAIGYRRTLGVVDSAGGTPTTVATVASWPGELTIPGERTLPAWAISSVSVAPTHKRRGIARALLEGELRTAADLGLPMAMLTVSESTLYGRYGFAPAAMAAHYTIETRRAHWNEHTPSGRVSFIEPEEFRALAPVLFERVRLQSPGEMEMWGGRWDQFSSLTPSGAGDKLRTLRAARFDDAEGELRGLVTFRVTGGEPDFTKHTLEVGYLLTETHDAYAALWRFLLEQPLVDTVKAGLRSVDEPVRWMISDWRAATVTTTDHLWLRVLDVAESFTRRSYVAPGRVGFEVTDDFGFADGRWVLETSDAGVGSVAKVDEFPADVPVLGLDVTELGALYLGGVLATTLVAAGRVAELTAGAAVAVDTVLRSPRTPWLSVWF